MVSRTKKDSEKETPPKMDKTRERKSSRRLRGMEEEDEVEEAEEEEEEDEEEDEDESPSPAKRTRSSMKFNAPKADANDLNDVPESGARSEQDLNSSFLADDASSVLSFGSAGEAQARSLTPTSTVKKRHSQSKMLLRPKLRYNCSCWVQEEHQQPIFGVALNNAFGPRSDDSNATIPQLCATAGANRLSIYQCCHDGSLKLLTVYTDADSEEIFYTCAWTVETTTGNPLVAVGGARGVIRIVSPVSQSCEKFFVGHGQAVNELRVHPVNPNLLLSVSKDHDLRLWNIQTEFCIVIFGGADGHRDEVLSADFSLSGESVVSCGMDHSIRIWKLNHDNIKNAIKESYHYNPTSKKSPGRTPLTVRQHYPDYCNRDIHKNYVDCVRYFGELIISKSCENKIEIWKPGKLDQPEGYKITSSGDSEATKIHTFSYKWCDIWYMRFSLDPRKRILALGNTFGKIYAWDVDVDDPSQAKQSEFTHPKCTSAIRQTALSKDGRILLAVCDDGTLWRWDHVAGGSLVKQ